MARGLVGVAARSVRPGIKTSGQLLYNRGMEKKVLQRKLINWRSVLPKLDNPKKRPNDYQRLVLNCLNNGMTVQDAQRVFGISRMAIVDWRRQFSGISTAADSVYFMERARKLGADDETIAYWFSIERIDKVAMILAGK